MAGRPKLSDEEKARRAQEREAAKVNGNVPVEAKRERRNPLQLAVAATLAFNEAMAALEAYRGRRGLFETAEFNELHDLSVFMELAFSNLQREGGAIAPQITAMAEKAEMANRIAELEAQLAMSQEQLRVTGNSDKIPSLKLKAKSVKVVTSPEPANAA